MVQSLLTTLDLGLVSQTSDPQILLHVRITLTAGALKKKEKNISVLR